MPGFHPRTFSFLLMARSNQKQRIPKDNRNGENSKSRIKCGFYLDSSQFLVRGRSPDPLRSLKPDKGTSSMPSRTLFLVATFETHRLLSPPQLVASRAPATGRGEPPESPKLSHPHLGWRSNTATAIQRPRPKNKVCRHAPI
jgi:hypothetical protein